jgi:hypothetical protein
MDAITHYKEFVIRASESEPSRWKFDIRKADGSDIRTFPDGKHFSSITFPTEYLTADAAIEEAKKLIDAGGMS